MDPAFRSNKDLWVVAVVIGIAVPVLEFMLEAPAVDDRGVDLTAIAIVVVVPAFFVWQVGIRKRSNRSVTPA